MKPSDKRKGKLMRNLWAVFAVSLFCISYPPLISHVIAAEDQPYPMTEIANSVATIQIYLPDPDRGYYRGSRFDWSGLVQQVKYKEHTFFGDWKTTHNPTNNDDVNGPVNEFGMTSPLGFDQAATGESFVKIGIGKLQKSGRTAYQFYENYPVVEAFPWTITQGENWIEFGQEMAPFRGWAYRYIKRVELDAEKPVFTILHTLHNTGTNPIDTDYYCHNFTILDDDPIGTHYRLQFPFPVTARQSLNRIAEAVDDQIVFLRDLTRGSLFTELDGHKPIPEHNKVTVANTHTGAEIRIEGNRAPYKINFYAAPLAVCPEAFIEVKIAPGETFEWQNRYTLFVQTHSSALE